MIHHHFTLLDGKSQLLSCKHQITFHESPHQPTQIRDRVRELGIELSREYAGRPLPILGVPDLKGRDVLILGDIFDTGNTMVGMHEAVSG